MDTNTTNTTNTAPAQQAPVKMGKLKTSFMITKESWNVLKQDSNMMLFPIISLILTLLSCAVFFGVLYFIFTQAGDRIDALSETQLDIIGYVIGFLGYLITFFIANYFMACIYFMAHARFNGQAVTFSQSISKTNSYIGRIFAWSAVSATVGVVLKAIAEKSETAGKIVAWLFGAAWNVLTYFSLPFLIIGDRSIKNSFTDSAALIRKTWGEAIIINLGLSAFFGLLTFLSIALAIGVIVLVPTTIMMIVVGVLLVVVLVVMAVISSTLSAILKLALYEYASTGKIPSGFTPGLIQNMITTKK